MTALILKRLAMLPLVVISVTLAMQLLYMLLPGDPAVTLAGGENASITEVARIRSELHLDAPFYVQYLDWLQHAVHLDFGTSLLTGQNVADELARRLPATIALGIAAFVIAIPLGMLGGALAAVFRRSWFDRALLAVSSAGMAIPAFVIAIMLVVVLAVQLRLLPAIGYVPLADDPIRWAQHIVMPAVAVSVAPAARIARTLRGSLIHSIDSTYVLAAWSKGATPRSALLGHALKNSLVPTVTVLGLQVDLVIGGSLVVETIFSIPGVGAYVANAATSVDLPIIQASAVVFAFATVLANLAVDIAYGRLNPKVRVAS